MTATRPGHAGATPSLADQRWMRRAFRLARAGTGATYPNPCVGAVVVAGESVVGAARSGPTGGPHAEVRALAAAGAGARGATLYVTLEPCDHVGRTGPCTGAIVEAGVREVVVSVLDPNPPMRGKGVSRLRRAGIRVRTGVLEDEGRRVHEHYLHHHATGLPFVTLKAAVSIDGCIATRGGDSRWITGEGARRDAHRIRARHHAIAVGAATVLADDPRLTVRGVRGVDPVPIVFDPRLSLARAGSRPWLLREGTWVLHGSNASARSRRTVERTGARTLSVRTTAEGLLSVRAALRALGSRDIRSLMVEGGGRLLGAFVATEAWQRAVIYRAPVILGAGRPVFGGFESRTVRRAPRVRRVSVRVVGGDVRETYEPGSDAPKTA